MRQDYHILFWKSVGNLDPYQLVDNKTSNAIYPQNTLFDSEKCNDDALLKELMSNIEKKYHRPHCVI